ncbi:hypothetical protein QQX98_008559 [Neonectria punicea]|uniref:Dynamin stalk domain-containing protein n=1 Tax=Neonectria punicea TaxID=979145 RepID=A0ABR1GUP8_9HYPO
MDITTVNRAVKRYLKDERSIILVVVDGSHDPVNQPGPRMAKKYDKDGKRTLGILTRLDAAERRPSQEIGLKCALNKDIVFNLGWHCLRNRTSVERRDGRTDADRDRVEAQFFSEPPWDKIKDRDKGTQNLREKLGGLLLDHIRVHLPALIAETTAARGRRIMEDKQLGVPLITYREQRNYLSSMAKNFQEMTEQALGGKYDNALFGSLGDNSLVSQQARLRANIREMNRLFRRVMLEAGRKLNIEQESDGDDSASGSKDIGENEPGQRSEGSGLSDAYPRGSQDELAPMSPSIDVDESSRPARVFSALDSEPSDSDVEVSLSVLPKTVVFLFYTHKKPRLVTREETEVSVLRFVARWRGTEGHGDTNTALTKEVYKVQTSPWEAIVGDHSQALWQAVEQFVTLALVETVDARVRREVEKEIIKPAMKQLQKRFFAKRQEILEAHRNIDPSCYDGLINRPALTAQSNKLAKRLGLWAGDNSEQQDATDDRTYTNFPLEMEKVFCGEDRRPC